MSSYLFLIVVNTETNKFVHLGTGISCGFGLRKSCRHHSVIGLTMELECEAEPEAATNLAAANKWLRDHASEWWLRDGYDVTRNNADVMPHLLRRALLSTPGPRRPPPTPPEPPPTFEVLVEEMGDL